MYKLTPNLVRNILRFRLHFNDFDIFFIILLTACQFACRAVLKFCMLIIILLIDWLFDFIDVNANLHIKHRTQKRTDQ